VSLSTRGRDAVEDCKRGRTRGSITPENSLHRCRGGGAIHLLLARCRRGAERAGETCRRVGHARECDVAPLSLHLLIGGEGDGSRDHDDNEGRHGRELPLDRR
jgi:hypothetical protein